MKLKVDKIELSNYFIENNFAHKRKTIIQNIHQLNAGEIGKFHGFNRKNSIHVFFDI